MCAVALVFRVCTVYFGPQQQQLTTHSLDAMKEKHTTTAQAQSKISKPPPWKKLTVPCANPCVFCLFIQCKAVRHGE